MRARCVVGYMLATHRFEQEEKSFRMYVTESLRLRGENRYLSQPWHELIAERPRDDRTADEIVDDVLARFGGSE